MSTTASPETLLIEALNAPGPWTTNLHESFPTYEFGIIKGTKYLKIFKKYPGSEHGSVVCFVDRKTGVIKNAKSWTQPSHIIGKVRDWVA